jgi:hypothetical protein
MLLFLGTFDVHRRDWRALLRRMRLLRPGHKRQKTLVLRVKWQKTIELRKKARYNPPSPPQPNSLNKNAAICAALLLLPNYHLFKLILLIIVGGCPILGAERMLVRKAPAFFVQMDCLCLSAISVELQKLQGRNCCSRC